MCNCCSTNIWSTVWILTDAATQILLFLIGTVAVISMWESKCWNEKTLVWDTVNSASRLHWVTYWFLEIDKSHHFSASQFPLLNHEFVELWLRSLRFLLCFHFLHHFINQKTWVSWLQAKWLQSLQFLTTCPLITLVVLSANIWIF